MRCVDKGTVSGWRSICDILGALNGKVDLSQLSSFQPTHAREIAHHFRRKNKEWDEETQDDIAEWVERCEAEEWTVEERGANRPRLIAAVAQSQHLLAVPDP
jgi:hypothetical protein